jgi:hypothetical protein
MFHSPTRPSMARPRFGTRILIKLSTQGLAILGSVLVVLSFALPSASALAQSVFNCSGFNASTGACSVYVNDGGSHPQQFNIRVAYTTPVFSGTRLQFVPPNYSHNAATMTYFQQVAFTPGFTSTFQFIPNGQNLGFGLENTNNVPSSYQGVAFSSGAGCEDGFYQADLSPGTGFPFSPNNIWAMQVNNNQGALTYAGGGGNPQFTHSNVQMFVSGVTPCLPADVLGPAYVATNKISTAPLEQGTANVQFSTTGDVYSASITYTGAYATLQMYDVTAGGACPGANCFTHTWPISIPPVVAGTTAWVHLFEGSNQNLPGATWINNWSFTTLSAAATPTFSPAGATYGSTQSVTISDSTGSSYICYNFTGAPGTNGIGGCANGTLYSGAISVPSGRTIYAVAGVSGTTADSVVASAAYNITGTGSIPAFNQPAGTFQGDQTVQLTAAQGGVICYNTTGSPATNGTTGCTTGTLYTTPIAVSSNETIYAVAGGTGLSDSTVGSAAYIINPYWDGSSPDGQAPANSPTFSPVPGTYSGTQTVTISSAATGATTPIICYTLSASPPALTPEVGTESGTCAQGTLYTGPISVSSTQTLYAMAGTMLDSLPSSLVKGTYTINPPGGSVRPAPPTLLGAQAH